MGCSPSLVSKTLTVPSMLLRRPALLAKGQLISGQAVWAHLGLVLQISQALLLQCC